MNYELTLGFEKADLPREMQLSWQRQSPFFAQEGSFSLPFTLPDTAHNRRLFGFINRPDRASTGSATAGQYTAILTTGALQQQVTLTVLSYTPDSGFEVSLLLGESSIWNQLRDITLKQVLQGHSYNVETTLRTPLRSGGTETPSGSTYPIRYDDTTDQDTVAALFDDIRGRLTNAADNDPDSEFEVFPVMTPRGIINEPGLTHDYFFVDGEVTAGPQGIGYTVFLHLKYVLEAVFSYIGRELSYIWPVITDESGNCFSDIFNRMVILNQTVDALVPGKIYYDTLVPDISVMDMLQAMQGMFGASFAEERDGSVSMRFLEEILQDVPQQEAGISAAQLQQIAYKEPVLLSVTPEHIRHDDDPAPTWEELKTNYLLPDGEIHTLTDEELGELGLGSLPDGLQRGQLCRRHDDFGGKLYAIVNTEDDGVELRDVAEDQLDGLYPASGICDDSIGKTSIDCPLSDTREADLSQLPELKSDDQMTAAMYSGYGHHLLMPLMPGMRNETCTVQQTVTEDDGEGGQTSTTKDITLSDDCPLCLAYILNRQGRANGSTYYNTRRGSAFLLPTSIDGTDTTFQTSTDNMFDLCAQGMMQTMHRSYAEALYAGAHEVTFTARMTQVQIHTFDFCRTYVINGSRYLPLQLQTQTTDNDLQQVTLTMLLLS